MTANVVGEHPRPVVYRLQGIPEYVKTLDQVKEVLRHGRGELHDICEPEIFSLATGIPHARTSRPTKVATLMFNPRHSSRQQQHEPANLNPESIIQSVNCVKDGLVLDSDFLGLTPLNDISVGVHQHDFIAVSGIGSHPFGSWQPHGGDKRFMWLRDALPKTFPSSRVILYGYETELRNTNSFQKISDIAGTFVTFLDIMYRNSDAQPSVSFIAHSLGGIVLKEALVQLAHSFRIKSREELLENVVGAVFFGVPNYGMVIEHLLSLADGQPNQQLIEDLKEGSPYLRRLTGQFRDKLSDKTFFWGYETKESRIPVLDYMTKTWTSRHPAAPFRRLVSVKSATLGLEQVPNRKHETFQIDEEHSNMVKFVSMHDKNLIIAISALTRILENLPSAVIQEAPEASSVASTEFSGQESLLIYASSSSRETSSQPPAHHVFVKLPTESPNAPTLETIFGREDDLDKMAKILRAPSSHGATILSVYGAPGIGKTQLVAHYISKYRGDYDNVFYLDSQTTTTLLGTLQVEIDRLKSESSWAEYFLSALSWADTCAASAGRFVSYLRKEGNDRWLLVVDEMQQNPVILDVVNQLRNGTIILISSSRRSSALYPAIRVGPLSLGPSIDMLCHHAESLGIVAPPMDTMKRFVSSLDRHPSLILLAARDLHTFRSANRSAKPWGHAGLSSRLSLRIKSILQSEFPGGLPKRQLELLRLFIMFDYQNITSQFLDCIGLEDLSSFFSNTSTALARHGLIDIVIPRGDSPTRYRISALMFNYVRQKLRNQELAFILSDAIAVVARSVPRSSNDNYESPVRLLLPHCKTLANFATTISASSTPKPGQYLSHLQRIASCFRIVGQDGQAIKLYGYVHREITSLTLNVDILPRQVAEFYNNMGLSWMNEGDVRFAIMCFHRAVAILSAAGRAGQESGVLTLAQRLADMQLDSIIHWPEDFAPGDFSLVRKAIVNKAWAKIRLEDYHDALAILDDPSGRCPDAAASAAELHARGYILTQLGKTDDGISTLQRAHEMALATRRTGEWFALTILHDLATAYRDGKKWDEAIRRYKTVIEGRTQIHGRRHRYTIESISALAVAYHGHGQQEEAASQFRIALQWHQENRPNHPDAIQTLQNYGAFLAETGDAKAAQQALRLAYEGRCQQDQKLNITTWSRVNCGVSLAVTLQNLKMYKESIELLDYAVSWHQTQFAMISVGILAARDPLQMDAAANQYCKALYLRGNTYEAWGKLVAAKVSYTAAAGIPTSDTGQANYWKVLALKGLDRLSHLIYNLRRLGEGS